MKKHCKKAKLLAVKLRCLLRGEAGDFYVSDAVRVILAVVLGALLLAAVTLLFNSTILPRITTEVQNLFN